MERQVKFPSYCYGNDEFSRGFNKAIDACIKAYKEAQVTSGKGEYRANFLWPHENGSFEQLMYEFANAKTEEYRKSVYEAICSTFTAKPKELEQSELSALEDLEEELVGINAVYHFGSDENLTPDISIKQIAKTLALAGYRRHAKPKVMSVKQIKKTLEKSIDKIGLEVKFWTHEFLNNRPEEDCVAILAQAIHDEMNKTNKGE